MVKTFPHKKRKDAKKSWKHPDINHISSHLITMCIYIYIQEWDSGHFSNKIVFFLVNVTKFPKKTSLGYTIWSYLYSSSTLDKVTWI